MNTPSTDISPGLGGFLVFFALAIALWLLVRSMNGHLRRIDYKSKQEGAPRRRTQHERRTDDGTAAYAGGAEGAQRGDRDQDDSGSDADTGSDSGADSGGGSSDGGGGGDSGGGGGGD